MDHEPLDLGAIVPKQKDEDLAGLMKKMQIDVVGRESGKDSNDGMSSGEDEDDIEEDDDDEAEEGEEGEKQQVSGKHTKFTDLEDRAREDMDFPDEVDTPFVNAA